MIEGFERGLPELGISQWVSRVGSTANSVSEVTETKAQTASVCLQPIRSKAQVRPKAHDRRSQPPGLSTPLLGSSRLQKMPMQNRGRVRAAAQGDGTRQKLLRTGVLRPPAPLPHTTIPGTSDLNLWPCFVHLPFSQGLFLTAQFFTHCRCLLGPLSPAPDRCPLPLICIYTSTLDCVVADDRNRICHNRQVNRLAIFCFTMRFKKFIFVYGSGA